VLGAGRNEFTYGWVMDQDASALVCCRRTVTDPPWQLPVAEIFAVQSHGFGPVNQAKSPICGMFVAPTQVCGPSVMVYAT
jgi:hypothetical protein